VRSDNLNEARLYGFESGMRYLASVGAEFYAVLNYTRGEESSPDGATTAADRIPPLSGRLGLLWEPGQRWRIEPHIDFAAAQDRLSPRDESDPRIRPGGTAGWGSVNLLASWEVTTTFTLGLKLQNLGDKNYREHGSGIDAAGRSLGCWVDVLF